MVKEQEKPFIHLLRSPNLGYFFDVNRNEIVPVSDEAFEFLSQVMKDERPWEKDAPEEIRELKENGYLSSHHVKEIEHPYTSYLNSIISRNMRQITLQLTQNCNFRCKYCVYSQNIETQRKHTNKSMTFDIAKEAIDLIHDHSVDCDSIAVSFYGGEPLLEFDLLKKSVKYAKQKLRGKDVRFTITTNVSLLDDDIVEFFIKNNFNVLLSLDGPKEINDKNRVFASGKGTFDTVSQKLNNIQSKYPDFYDKIMFNMVVDPSNDFDRYNELYNKGIIKSLSQFSYSIIDDTLSESPNIYSEEFVSKMEYQQFLGILSLLGKYPNERLPLITQKWVSVLSDEREKFSPFNTLPDRASPSGPCIPGELRPMVTVDGNIISCERVNEMTDTMIVGKIGTGSKSDGINMVKVSSLLNVAKQTENQCKECWAFTHCGLCGRYSDHAGCFDGENRLKYCNERKLNFHEFLLREILLSEGISAWIGDEMDEPKSINLSL